MPRRRIPPQADNGRHASDARHPRAPTSLTATSGCTRSSGTACGCSPTSSATRAERVRLTSRTENDVTVSFPELLDLPGDDLLLDGEVVALRRRAGPASRPWPSGCTSSRADRARGWPRPRPVTFLVFDVLRLDGRDLSREPLTRPAASCSRGSAWPTCTGRCPPAYDDGRDAVAGHRAAGTRGDREQAAWVALRVRRPQPALAEVPAPPAGVLRRRGLAARDRVRPAGSARCSWASPTAAGLVYRGRVGSGIAGKVGPMLQGGADPARAGHQPVRHRGAARRRRSAPTGWSRSWSSTSRHSGSSAQQRLRQPSYRGVRPDLTPTDARPDCARPEREDLR